MQDLRLVAANDVGSHLLLRSMMGEEFRVPIDERLRAAVRGDRARFGQLEIELDSRLRPRDIQARIRAGQSAEEVAHQAGVPVERVRRFEGPVLAERGHMAQLAQRASVRRGGHSEGHSVLLGDAVTARLDPLGVRDETLDWDSWRREDGRWTVRLAFSLEAQPHRAHFVYDPRARTTVADDDEARWLVGELAERPSPAPFLPRLAPAPPDAADVDAGQVDEGSTRLERVERDEPVRRPRRASALDILVPPPAGGVRPERPQRPERPSPRVDRPAAHLDRPAAHLDRPAAHLDRPAPVERQAAQVESAAARPASAADSPHLIPPEERLTGTADARPERPAERPSARAAVRGRRASVPSWDDILFGTRRRSD